MDLNEQFIQASLLCDLETVKKLIQKGANVHACDDEALRMAAWYGDLDIVKYLVGEAGANIHAMDDSALCLAALSGHLETVKYLVSNGANIHVYDDTVLRWADGHLEIVKYLKTYLVSQFTKKHIDKQNLRYVFQQYKLPFEIKQIISSYI